MAIQGSIEEAGLPDVLQLLALGRKTGCLSVVDADVRGEIYLNGGRVSYATVANRPDRFGEILVKNGVITQDQLQGAIEEQARGPKRQIGRILVDSGQIDRNDLERYVRLQVEEAVYFLFARKSGEFTFHSDQRTPQQFLAETLDAEALLLEGARRVDEWSRIQKKIPAFDCVCRRTKDTHTAEVAAELTEAQKRILPLLDGTRDVNGVVEMTGMAEFDVGKALYGLILAGFAQIVERRSRVRHLEYRELLAWVVREAEYADPQRRKEAGRHIVDCPTCAERLRTIQVRRTEGSGIPVATVTRTTPLPRRTSAPQREPALATLAPAAPAHAMPPAPVQAMAPAPVQGAPPTRAPGQPIESPWREPAPAVPAHRAPSPTMAPTREPAPAMTPAPEAEPVYYRPNAAAAPLPDRRARDRRVRDRRTGFDRRAADRRTGIDRRHEANPSWANAHPERRRELRREAERRLGGTGDRRSGNGDRHRGDTWVAEPAARQAGPGERTTELRLMQRLDLGERDWPQALEIPEASPLEPAAGAAGAGTSTAPLGAAPPSASPPAQSDARAPGFDWLVSPEESAEMLRASRPARRRSDIARAPAAPPAEPPAAVRLVPSAPEPPRQSPITSRFAGPADEGEARYATPGHLTWGGNEAVPRAGDGFLMPHIDWRAIPTRPVMVGAAIVGIALLAYSMGRGRTPHQEQPAAAASQAPAPEAAGSEPHAAVPAGTATRRAAQSPPASQRPAPSPPVVSTAQPARPGAAREPAPQPAARVPAVAVATPTPAPQPAAPRVEAPPPQPTPTVGVLRGVVHGPNGAALAGVRVTVRGTALSAVTDPAGAFEIRDVPDGAATLQATADGYTTASADVRARAGSVVTTDVALARPPVAATPDAELAEGGWGRVDRAEAISTLGGTLGAIDGLTIESIAKSTAGTRQRIRVVQLTAAGERIVLTETRAGAAVRGAEGPAHVTALRVLPPSEAYPFCTGTASFGNILITAKTTAAPDVLRTLLGRLSEITQ